MIACATFDSPIGLLTVSEEDGNITALDWGAQGRCGTPTPLLIEAGAQLDAYFAHRLERFDLPISCVSSPFLHGVMEALFSIPYGKTKTYGDIADYVRGSPQAVGRACASNPVPILIPCHRVLGVKTLGGYSGRGGVETKIWLLKHEGAAGLLL